MESLNRFQWHIFILTCLVIVVFLGLRAGSLFPLYVDAHIRGATQELITHIAEREGWLLSDIELRTVDDNGITILHRSHIRGEDPANCYRVDFRTASFHSCVE